MKKSTLVTSNVRRRLGKVFAFFVSIASTATFMPACSLLPQYHDPKSMEINGETYITGFYENLWPDGVVFNEGDAPDFETKYHTWWKVESSLFDMYCAQNKEALFWNPTIYCQESQFDAAKQYYADAGNFNYYTGLYGDSHESERVLLDGNTNFALLEEAVALNMRIEANLGKGLLTGKEDFSDIEVHLPQDEVLPIQPVLYRVSKDGYFTTIQNSWILTEQEIYIAGAYDGEEESYTAYKIGNESNEYILELLSENGITSRFRSMETL